VTPLLQPFALFNLIMMNSSQSDGNRKMNVGGGTKKPTARGPPRTNNNDKNGGARPTAGGAAQVGPPRTNNKNGGAVASPSTGGAPAVKKTKVEKKQGKRALQLAAMEVRWASRTFVLVCEMIHLLTSSSFKYSYYRKKQRPKTLTFVNVSANLLEVSRALWLT
jgi:hypothetical protein